MSDQVLWNEQLRVALAEYRTKGRSKPLTMEALGRKLGMESGTAVNKYLCLTPGRKPEGDIDGLERKIADLLKAESRRSVIDIAPFETNVTKLTHAAFDLCSKTSDVALVSGPAGIGKTVAISLFCMSHPLALSICVTKWRNDDIGVCALMFEQIESSTWDQHSPRATFMADHLRGSDRLIIVDNAHRLTSTARAWLFDFHDLTGCPIALVGNPEVLTAIRLNDQHFSRIGIHQKVDLDARHTADYARKICDAIVPGSQNGVYDLATAVASEKGHLRALKKQLMLMKDMASSSVYAGDQIKAFRAAHSKLVRDYEL